MHDALPDRHLHGPRGPLDERHRGQGINVDTTAPSLSWTAPVADGSEFYFGSVPPQPGVEADDALAGLAGPCSVDGYGTAVGDHEITAAAVDNAGNRSELRTPYRVLPWAIDRVLQARRHG